MITYRDLTSLDEFAPSSSSRRDDLGPSDAEDVVPVPILAVTVKRGGILIGAFDGDRMIGFVYSLAGIKDGKPTAVVAHARRARRVSGTPASAIT